jgi:hypothetical protein
MERLMEDKVEYSGFYLHAMQQIKMAHDSLVARDFKSAYDHCMNAQAEIKLMSGAVRTWIPVEEE